jgi:hypothetical protein
MAALSSCCTCAGVNVNVTDLPAGMLCGHEAAAWVFEDGWR